MTTAISTSTARPVVDDALIPVDGSGAVTISGSVALQVFVKLEASGIQFDDMVHELSYELPAASTNLQPFDMSDAAPVEVEAELPRAN